MTRNLKALGLALLALFALGAVAASAASAAEEFHADGEKAIITGENEAGTEDSFAIGEAGTIKCKKTTLEGTNKAETTTTPGSEYTNDKLTITPHYEECTFAGSLEAHVKFNHCAYVFSSDTTLGNTTKAEKHANVEIECAAGNKVEVDITGFCTLTIPAQTIKHAVRYKADTATSVTVESTATKVKVEKTKTTPDQTNCLLVPTGEIGTYTGKATVSCYKDNGVETETTAKTTPVTEETGEGIPTNCRYE
jgi:hypothetical protein